MSTTDPTPSAVDRPWLYAEDKGEEDWIWGGDTLEEAISAGLSYWTPEELESGGFWVAPAHRSVNEDDSQEHDYTVETDKAEWIPVERSPYQPQPRDTNALREAVEDVINDELDGEYVTSEKWRIADRIVAAITPFLAPSALEEEWIDEAATALAHDSKRFAESDIYMTPDWIAEKIRQYRYEATKGAGK